MVRLPTGHQHGRADGPDGLLATKLYLPRLQPGFVPRPRLVDRLDEALARGLVLGLCASRLRQDRSAGDIQTVGDLDWLAVGWNRPVRINQR